MGLVDYSDSDDDADDSATEQTSPRPSSAKRQKVSSTISTSTTHLPPLPAGFHDLYSSTVRTSTRDEPSLHGGRKRVTPHVEGNWPTHVYLEWVPSPAEYQVLSRLIDTQVAKNDSLGKTKQDDDAIHSLLQSDLGAPLPLHISLSRPLVLKTDRKDAFLDRLRNAVQSASARSFDVNPVTLSWHPNESKSRWFLVLHFGQRSSDQLAKLLEACNGVAHKFDQPLLYQESTRGTPDDKFHISIAWSLSKPSQTREPTTPIDASNLIIPFSAAKVRIGQDVTTIELPRRQVKSNEPTNQP